MIIKKRSIHAVVLGVIVVLASCTSSNTNKKNSTSVPEDSVLEKTVFQTGSGWVPEIDVRADVAIVYGVNGNPSDQSQLNSFETRLQSWRDHGYQTHFMTGIAWGSYQDYFLAKWDGKEHFDEGKVQRDGDTIWHG